jgi:hypothetical protein
MRGMMSKRMNTAALTGGVQLGEGLPASLFQARIPMKKAAGNAIVFTIAKTVGNRYPRYFLTNPHARIVQYSEAGTIRIARSESRVR